MPAYNTAEKSREAVARWYTTLSIDPRWEADFLRTLENTPLPDTRDILSYIAENPKGPAVLPILLSHIDALAERYRELGIPEDILVATLDDLRIYTEEWSEATGAYTFGTTSWFKRHFSVTLFRLGRLQFGMTPAPIDAPAVGLVKGEPTVDVHIPRGDRLTPEVCRAAFCEARAFFKKYFPDYNYKFFTCNSWLLDPTLIDFMSQESNIIQFGNMFHRVRTQKRNYMLDYLYPIGTTVEQLKDITPTTRLAAAVKEALLAGRSFYPSFGVIPADFFDDKE